MDKKKLANVKRNIEQHQIDTIKHITEMTLEKIMEKEHTRNALQEEIRILRHDISDLKEGRLDRMVDRQNIAKEALEASAFTIKKDTGSKTTNQWYVPYIVQYDDTRSEINNSVAKTHTSGSYKLSDGTIKYI